MVLSSLNIVTLSNLRGIGNKTIIKIGNHIQTKRISVDTPTQLLSVIIQVKPKSDFSIEDIEDAERNARYILNKSQENGIGVMGYFDEDFPELLRECIDDSGKNNPPVLLYYKGDKSILSMPKLAIIGTREILPEGEKAGLYLSREFAKRGFCIVSGLAIGCDTVGHRGALDVGGKTIAFLAHGLDSIYPPENEALANDIVEQGGLLISEYPIGEPLNKYYLVARDRLQAGISKATLVIHTDTHGGTMHAANATLLSNKPLYVVKFQEEMVMKNEKCAGNIYLANNGARYISGADNIDKVCFEIVNSSNSLF